MSKKVCLLPVFVFLFLYILPLGVRPLSVPDETRYAEISREMIETGNFVVPRLDGFRYFEKPVMGYWLNAASIKMLGENEFSARFASALSAGLCALMLFFLARRFIAESFAAVLTPLILLTCFGFFGIGVNNVLDSMFCFFLTAALVCFFYADSSYAASERRCRMIFLMCCGIFVGCAFLTKGFLAIAVPVTVIVPFLLWGKKWKDLYTVPWIPLAAAVMVILPWALMVHLKEPDFWHYFFWEEHIRRFTADTAQHKAPFYYYLVYFPALVIPWTFLFPAVFSGIRKKKIHQPVIKFALCWFIFPFLFFSISKGKLLTYVLPCMVPFALLVAVGLINFWEIYQNIQPGDEPVNRIKLGAMAGAFFFGLVGIALLVLHFTDMFHFKPYAHLWKTGIGGAASFCCMVVYLWAAFMKAGKKQVLVFAMAPVVFMFCIHFLYPDAVIDKKSPGSFLMKHSDKITPDTVIISDYSPIRAVCWYYKRRDVFLVGSTGELTYGASYEDSKYRHLNLGQLHALIDQNQHNIVLVARAEYFEKWEPELPQPVFEDGNGKFVFVMF